MTTDPGGGQKPDMTEPGSRCEDVGGENVRRDMTVCAQTRMISRVVQFNPADSSDDVSRCSASVCPKVCPVRSTRIENVEDSKVLSAMPDVFMSYNHKDK